MSDDSTPSPATHHSTLADLRATFEVLVRRAYREAVEPVTWSARRYPTTPPHGPGYEVKAAIPAPGTEAGEVAWSLRMADDAASDAEVREVGQMEVDRRTEYVLTDQLVTAALWTAADRVMLHPEGTTPDMLVSLAELVMVRRSGAPFVTMSWPKPKP